MTTAINALAGETSPYLLQHAHNPVQWYPWADEALNLARRADKPILLSIGYSACHWCHVMAHESFEDAQTAQVMNAHFVNIKVDREERPDLDKIYQTAHQILTRRGGGWPLTVILTPDDHMPIFAGTYFPREPRHGLPAFKELLQRIAAYYRENRAAVRSHVAEMQRILVGIQAAEHAGATGGLSEAPLVNAQRQMEEEFDQRWGGFGSAPKFPQTSSLERLMRHHALMQQRGDSPSHALRMAVLTLERMALGGLFDQIGGGFFRYSVDREWLIPHFEKMLYDNGALLAVYASALQLTSQPLFRRTLELCGEWLIREMQSPLGGYYCSLDADSDGHEGKYYLWTPDEIKALLDGPSHRLAIRYYGLDRPSNFDGAWHLHVAAPSSQLAQEVAMDAAAIDHQIDQARPALAQARARRTAPGRDEKILTSWNALTIRGMLEAGYALERGDFIQSADRALTFLRNHLWQNGRLLACYKDGRTRFNAYLDDYAFLLLAMLVALEVRWRDDDLAFARTLADALLEQFEDTPDGGFFFTSHDHETLVHRPKSFSDDALPNGSGVAALALTRLGHLLGETRYLDAGRRCVEAASAAVSRMPHAHSSMLDALEEVLYRPSLVFLRGDPAEVAAWQRKLRGPATPRRRVYPILAGGAQLPGGATAAPQNGVVAYRCDGYACSAPITDLAMLETELARSETEALRRR